MFSWERIVATATSTRNKIISQIIFSHQNTTTTTNTFAEPTNLPTHTHHISFTVSCSCERCYNLLSCLGFFLFCYHLWCVCSRRWCTRVCMCACACICRLNGVRLFVAWVVWLVCLLALSLIWSWRSTKTPNHLRLSSSEIIFLLLLLLFICSVLRMCVGIVCNHCCCCLRW